MPFLEKCLRSYIVEVIVIEKRFQLCSYHFGSDALAPNNQSGDPRSQVLVFFRQAHLPAQPLRHQQEVGAHSVLKRKEVLKLLKEEEEGEVKRDLHQYGRLQCRDRTRMR